MGGMRICRDDELSNHATRPSRSAKITHCDVMCSPLSAVTCMATNGDDIAAVRDNGRIQICRRHGRYVIVNFTIPFAKPNRTDYVITQIAWIGSRLFTSDLDGTLTEWNLNRRCPLQTSSSYGGPVFCMAVRQSKIILGCMDGSLRLFDSGSLSLNYVRSFQSAIPNAKATRVTAVVFLDNETVAASYSNSMISVYNIVTSQVISQFSTPSRIRALCLTPDQSALVSGSTDGKLYFWCLKTFTLIETLSTHSADITSIVAAGYEIVAAGLDRKVVYVQASGQTFIQTKAVRQHRNDILCIVTSGDDAIVSAGCDGQLIVTIGNQYSAASPFSHTADLTCSSNANTFAVLSGANSVVIWRDSQICSRYQCTAGLLSASLSPSANFLVTSTSSRSFLFSLNTTSKGKLVLEHHQQQQHLPALSHIVFSSDSSTIYAVDIDEQRLRSFEVAGATETRSSDPLPTICTRLVISPDDSFLSIADLDGLVSVYSTSDLRLVATLPRMRASVSAMAFGSFNSSNVIALITADNCLYIFDLDQNQLILPEFVTALHHSISNLHSRRLLDRASIVFRIEFSSSTPNVLMLVSNTFIAKLNLNASPEVIPTTRSLTEHRAGIEDSSASRVIVHSAALQLIDFYSTPIQQAVFSGDDITVVESSWTQLNAGVIAPIERHRFANTI